MPDAWKAIVHVDVLYREEIAFPEKWQGDGVKIRVQEHANPPHTLLLVAKLLGLPAIDDVVEVVRTVVDLGQEQLVPDQAHVTHPLRLLVANQVQG